MLPSSASNSSQSSFDSPISQYPPQQHAWVNILPRRQPIPKYPRFYSTPLNQEEPDSTPLQIYGLEEREPSIAERPRRFVRFSRALDDIKEDFTSPTTPNPRNTAEAIRARRQSTFSSFFFDNNSNPTLGVSRSSTSASLSTSNFHGHSNASSVSVAIPPPPPIPNDDEQEQPMKLGRRLTRRLSRLSFSQRRASYRAGNASISQPNLIGSSNQL
ncbi:uncharacterized protein BDV14DRAFT_199478 [Aspergillus stella-maris]|uniref:uncharacterized protein n=1 Tax=Aspergillus stella-maris TaxID=1810926 RepID=UPI003CCE12D1